MGIWGDFACKVGLHNWSEWKYLKQGACQQKRICRRCDKEQKQVSHVWKNWVYESNNSCRLERMCHRCHEKEKGAIQHDWTGWQYESDDSCRLERLCRHCNQKEKGDIQHNWGEWQYESNDTCRLERICRHCNQKEKGEIQHDWDEWKYDPLEPEEQGRIEERFSQRIKTLQKENDALTEKLSELEKSIVVEVEAKQKFKLREAIEKLKVNQENVEKNRDFWQNRLKNLVNEGSSCRQSRICKHCAEEQKQEELQHQLAEWEYESLTSCQLVKFCQKCGEKMTDEKTAHQWGELINEGTRRVAYCERCGEKKVGGFVQPQVIVGEPEWDKMSPQQAERAKRMMRKH